MARGDKGFARARRTRTETGKPEPRGLAKGRDRASRANSAGDAVEEKMGRKGGGGKLSRAEMRALRGSKE